MELNEGGVPFDSVIAGIGKYAARQGHGDFSGEARTNGYHTVLDALACLLEALAFPDFVRRLGDPLGQRIICPHGVPIPGTSLRLDVRSAAIQIANGIRHTDRNDTYLKQEYGHPSDCHGAFWALGYHQSNKGRVFGHLVTMRDLIDDCIASTEIQGTLQESNPVKLRGIDHPYLLGPAVAARAAARLGGNSYHAAVAASHAFNILRLRAHRHGKCTSPRKSWSASEQVGLSLDYAIDAVLRGEPGLPTVLTEPQWGFNATVYRLAADRLAPGMENEIVLPRELGSTVMENILFKPRPAEYHAQTMIEAILAMRERLIAAIGGDFGKIAAIRVSTHSDFARILYKPDVKLTNYAARDHDGPYMAAATIIAGDLRAEHYTDEWAGANDDVIGALRAKTTVTVEPSYDDMYGVDGAVPNKVVIDIKGGPSLTEERLYPLGSRRMREQCFPVLLANFERAVRAHPRFRPGQVTDILRLCLNRPQFEATPVDQVLELFATAA